jgi:hypothetical protein
MGETTLPNLKDIDVTASRSHYEDARNIIEKPNLRFDISMM